MKRLLLSLTAGAAVLASATAVRATHEVPEIHSVTVQGVQCPTEDSCVVDYSDGAWHITEVTP